jgi:hypothetical protein
MRKRPVSIAFSERVLKRIDQEARKQKRTRSDWLEKHFEDLFFKEEQPLEIAIKTG